MTSYGTGYKDATVTVTAGTGLGSGAVVRAIISPDDGHGSNVHDELYVDALGVHCLFDDYGETLFNTNVTYRTIGLLKKIFNLFIRHTFQTEYYIFRISSRFYIIINNHFFISFAFRAFRERRTSRGSSLGRIYVSSFGFSCANSISVFALTRI